MPPKRQPNVLDTSTSQGGDAMSPQEQADAQASAIGMNPDKSDLANQQSQALQGPTQSDMAKSQQDAINPEWESKFQRNRQP